MRLHTYHWAAAIVLCSWSAHAAASEAVSSVGEAVPESSSAAVAPEGGLSEIVVTAQRRSENIQRAALAITAIDGAMLADQGVTTAQSLSTLVPSVTVGAYGPYTQVFLRGIGDFGGTPLSESPVAVNVDQVYEASPALTSSFFTTWTEPNC